MGLKVSYLESRARNSLEYMIFIVLGGLVLKIWPLLGGLSFRDSLFAPTPPIFRIAATRKRNGVEISNSQNFLVSMISTSILKGTSHDPIFQFSLFSTLADIFAV